MVDKSLVSRQEAKIRELETRLEFERTQVKRLEVGAHFSRPAVSRARLPPQWEHHACSASRTRQAAGSSEASAKLPGQLTAGACSLRPPSPHSGHP